MYLVFNLFTHTLMVPNSEIFVINRNLSKLENLTKTIISILQGPPGEQGSRGEAGPKGDKVRHESKKKENPTPAVCLQIKLFHINVILRFQHLATNGPQVSGQATTLPLVALCYKRHNQVVQPLITREQQLHTTNQSQSIE